MAGIIGLFGLVAGTERRRTGEWAGEPTTGHFLPTGPSTEVEITRSPRAARPRQQHPPYRVEVHPR